MVVLCAGDLNVTVECQLLSHVLMTADSSCGSVFELVYGGIYTPTTKTLVNYLGR